MQCFPGSGLVCRGSGWLVPAFCLVHHYNRQSRRLNPGHSLYYIISTNCTVRAALFFQTLHTPLCSAHATSSPSPLHTDSLSSFGEVGQMNFWEASAAGYLRMSVLTRDAGLVATATLQSWLFFSLHLKGGGGRKKEVAPRSVAGLVASLYTAAAVCKCMGAQRLLLLEGQLIGLRPTFVRTSSEMKRLNQV